MAILITAASSNHYKSAIQFLRSCPWTSATVFFYDIGLTKEEAKALQEEFPKMLYRKLDFTKLPDFAQLSAPHAGAYAWKPYIIHEVYSESKEDIVVWCDAGNVIRDWDALVKTVKHEGIYSPSSCFDVKTMTHLDCRLLLELPEVFWSSPMRNAAIVGFVGGDPVILSFVTAWKEKSLIQDIVIPKESSRADHRWDQSVLTCLMYKWDVRCTYDRIGVDIHQDCD